MSPKLTPTHEEHELADQQELVRQALANPIGSAPLRELAKGKDKVVVITSDHTRPLPSAITLPLYLEEIRKGNPEADITILIATGVHRYPTEAEKRAKYGDDICDHEKLIVHDANQDENLVLMGTLPSGGELWSLISSRASPEAERVSCPVLQDAVRCCIIITPASSMPASPARVC